MAQQRSSYDDLWVRLQSAYYELENLNRINRPAEPKWREMRDEVQQRIRNLRHRIKKHPDAPQTMPMPMGLTLVEESELEREGFSSEPE